MPEWMLAASCRQVDPEIFFPKLPGAAAAAEAKELCRRCPVQVECLEYALDRQDVWGVWGGLTTRERELVRRERGLRPTYRTVWTQQDQEWLVSHRRSGGGISSDRTD